MPARRSTSDSRTPRQRAVPIAPSVHAVPLTARPCCEVKKLRPLPAHSTNAVRVTWEASRSAKPKSTGPPVSPSPHTVSFQSVRSMRGVAV